MNLIFTLAICLLISAAFSFLARKLKVSVVVGLIFAGLLIGSPFLNKFILQPNADFILLLGEIGLITLMFLAGGEVSWSNLYKEKKESAYLAVIAFTTPLLLGFVVFKLMGLSTLTSLIIGICMSITAEATKARVLIELNKLKTKIGSLMMGAGIIDDVLGMFAFVIISFLLAHSIAQKELVIFFCAMFAFFAGIIVNKVTDGEVEKSKKMNKILLAVVVPFFFISMGIQFNLSSIIVNPRIFFVVLITAIAGKLLGSFFLKPFTKLNFRQLYLVGWGMNSRGAVELAIAFTALKANLIDTDIYSNLVSMALITTLIFPIFIRRLIAKYPKIMGN